METTPTATTAKLSLPELTGYQSKLEQLFQNFSAAGSATDNEQLKAFNGYYTLNTAPGAFFAIDTNMHVANGQVTTTIDIIISVDGITSVSIPFTGTFDGTNLALIYQGVDIGIKFTHTDGSDGTTASCTGAIFFNDVPGIIPIVGTTYNNPIPAKLYIGDYYETVNGRNIKVMSIGENYALSYGNGLDNGILVPVTTYSYNLNMYYFSFTQASGQVSLIMGTAAQKGFACNNMIVTGSGVRTRSLLTLPDAVAPEMKLYDVSGSALAGYSGYYQIPSLHPLAFVSVQAEYANMGDAIDVYSVMISVFDGVTSVGYYFDPLSMTFENNVLTMPDQAITLQFNRAYNPSDYSLVTITGSVRGENVTGSTLFNPVPLSVFGGVPMTNIKGDSLTVNSNNEVIYNGTKMDNFIYVPLMYILAYPLKNPSTVMSFGTSSVNGNTCIVTTNAASSSPQVSVVYAIPDGK